MSKIYRTAQGLKLNMETLRLKNEKEIAVGNMNINARGDQVDSSGNIIQTRNDILKNYYNQKGQK
jgi:hypothetical protein